MESELIRVSGEFKKIVDDIREKQKVTSAEATKKISEFLKNK